ncbi:MAG: hypothetical protein PHD19_09570 [Dechloromonas sp.]|nr:hypothetical protein [Dechloromonas sp.]
MESTTNDSSAACGQSVLTDGLGITCYTLTVTKEQAQTLIQATEILARLGIGQFRDALECLPTREFLPEGWSEDMDSIGQLLSRHMIGGIDGYRSSLGIHHNDVRKEAKIAWDLYQVLRHRLSWDRAVREGIVESADSPRKWPEMMQTHYDEPMKVSDQPLAIVMPNASGKPTDAAGGRSA